MKRYIVFDDYGELAKLVDREELKAMLVEEERNDIINNLDSVDIIKNELNTLCELAKGKSFEFIKNRLEPYGYSVLDLVDLQRDLSNYQAYKNGVGAPIIKQDCIEETLKMIESEMK